jgi:hypothetical protein
MNHVLNIIYMPLPVSEWIQVNGLEAEFHI